MKCIFQILYVLYDIFVCSFYQLLKKKVRSSLFLIAQNFISYMLRSFYEVHTNLEFLYFPGGLILFSLGTVFLYLIILVALKSAVSDISIVILVFFWLVLHGISFPILLLLPVLWSYT